LDKTIEIKLLGLTVSGINSIGKSAEQVIKMIKAGFVVSLYYYLIDFDVLDGEGEVSGKPVHGAISLPPLIGVGPLAVALLLHALRRNHQITAKTH